MDIRWDDRLSQTTATLNYLRQMSDRPVAYTYEPPPGTPWRSGTVAAEEVAIRDARLVSADLSLDEHGFALVQAATRVANLYDPHDVKTAYYPEAEAILKDVTGGRRVIVFDHNIRNAARAGQAGLKEPVKRVHNDFTLLSGSRRARDELTARGEDVSVLSQRFAIVNLWRPIQGPLLSDPLAVCDARTIAPEDWIATDLIYRDRVGETYSVAYNSDHRWFYFPQMARDEALLIKVFDSSDAVPARFSAHTAFDDPHTPEGAPPRESIELRALVLWG